jgi:hypothetical protein
LPTGGCSPAPWFLGAWSSSVNSAMGQCKVTTFKLHAGPFFSKMLSPDKDAALRQCRLKKISLSVSHYSSGQGIFLPPSLLPPPQ